VPVLYLEFFFVSPLDAESSPMFRRCSDDCVIVRCTAVNTTVVKPVGVAADSSVEGTVPYRLRFSIIILLLSRLTIYKGAPRSAHCVARTEGSNIEAEGRERGGGFLGSIPSTPARGLGTMCGGSNPLPTGYWSGEHEYERQQPLPSGYGVWGTL